MKNNVALFGLAISCVTLIAGSADYQDLAKRLANPSDRQLAVAQVVRATAIELPVLLSWTRTPPGNVDDPINLLKQDQLFIGMADVFAQLKTKEAIPFLVKHISLTRSDRNFWTKQAPVIQAELPCAAALISIGPDASKWVIDAYGKNQIPANDLLVAVFVVARIKPKDPSATLFLNYVRSDLTNAAYWAGQGLR